MGTSFCLWRVYYSYVIQDPPYSLMLQTCWQSFRLENLTITVSVVLPTWWHASVRSREISQPRFPNIFKTFSSRTSPDTSRGMPTISRHSRLEYWAFAQHCLSKVVHLVKNKLLAFFVTASSACSFEIDSLRLRTSSRTVSLSSNLLCRDKTIGHISCLHSLSSAWVPSVCCHIPVVKKLLRWKYRLQS